MHRLKKLLPFLDWLPDLNPHTLRVDLLSGVTVALVLVPQSMAYAQLAGLPPYYGLYAAFLPPMVATLFGSSRQLATGPVAVVSLMTAASLEPLATAGSEQYVAYAILLALLVGLFQFLLGALRLGLVVNFLSHPVVNGFTNAAAIIIATSQLSKVFGVQVDKAAHHYETVIRVVDAALDRTHLPTLGMAVLAFVIMVGLRRVDRRIPNVLVAVVVTTSLAWLVGFERNRSVTLDEIRSLEVVETVHAYNAAIHERATLEELRASSSRSAAEIPISQRDFCLGCHELRQVDGFRGGLTPGGTTRGADDRALALHHMAGLLDQRIAFLKEHASELREELRERTFVASGGDADSGLSTVGDGDRGPVGAERYRLKIGNGPLDPAGMTVTSGGAVVGAIPSGLPELRAPELDWAVIPRLFGAAIIISILGFMEAISIAKAMAARTRQRIDPNQELIGQGLANIVGCFSQSYAVSGSFSRSAVNLSAGARTGMSNVFCSAVVAIVLLFFTGLLYHLPQGVLAAIIMMAVIGLVNVGGFVHAWRTDRFDGMVSVVTFVGTLGFAPHLEWGILLGVGLSLGGYLYRSMRPRISELAPHPDGSLRDSARHRLSRCRFVTVIGFDGPLNFASATYLEDEILARVADNPDLRELVIAGHGITEIDASGEEMLRHLVDRLRAAGLGIAFAGLVDQVLDVLRRSHLLHRIGEDRVFATAEQAIATLYESSHRTGRDPDCPFDQTMPRLTELGLHPDGSLRNLVHHGLRRCRHIVAIRVEDPLDFTNTALFGAEILGRISGRPETRELLLVMHGVSDMDAVAAGRLEGLVRTLRERGVGTSLSGVKEHVLDVLESTGTRRTIGAERFYPTQAVAVAAIWSRVHDPAGEVDCPLASMASRLTELSAHPDGTLRDAARHGLAVCPSLAVIRLDGPLVLANLDALRSEVERWVLGRPEVHHLHLSASSIATMSPNDAATLLEVVEHARRLGFTVTISDLTDHVFEVLARTGVADLIGLDDIYPDARLALAARHPRVHTGADATVCPLAAVLPEIEELSLHPDGALRDARRHGLERCRHMAVFRLVGALDFATVVAFRDRLEAGLARRGSLSTVVLALHSVPRVDAIGAEELAEQVERLRARGLRVVLSGVADPVLEVLDRTGVGDRIGRGNLFPTQLQAVAATWAAAHVGSTEDACPLAPLAGDLRSPASA